MGIEISNLDANKEKILVTPRTGVGIEIFGQYVDIKKMGVIPRKGVGIEIHMSRNPYKG